MERRVISTSMPGRVASVLSRTNSTVAAANKAEGVRGV
jgi:hypothetical protein